MVMGIILARMLEPKVFGDLAYVSALLSFFMIPLGFSSAQRLVSDQGRTEGLFEKVMGMVWLITGAKLLVVLAFFAFFWLNGNYEYAWVGVLAGLPMALVDWVGVIRADLEGRGRFKPNFLVEISQVGFNALTSITLVSLGFGIYGLVFGGFLAFFLGLGIYWKQTDRKLSSARLQSSALKEQFRTGFWLWLDSTSAAWFYRIDKIFLGWAGGTTQLGYYNRAMNYGPISHMALNSLMTNPSVRALGSFSGIEEKRKYFKKIMLVLTFAAIANGIFWLVSAPVLVPWIFGFQWMGAVPAFQWLGWLGIPYCLAYGSSTVLLAHQFFARISFIRLIGLLALLSGLAVLWFLEGLTATSMAIAFMGALSFSGIIMFFSAIKLLYK
jgi:O-antigen/teichoic acid export membrane protein